MCFTKTSVSEITGTVRTNITKITELRNEPTIYNEVNIGHFGGYIIVCPGFFNLSLALVYSQLRLPLPLLTWQILVQCHSWITSCPLRAHLAPPRPLYFSSFLIFLPLLLFFILHHSASFTPRPPPPSPPPPSVLLRSLLRTSYEMSSTSGSTWMAALASVPSVCAPSRLVTSTTVSARLLAPSATWKKVVSWKGIIVKSAQSLSAG